MHELPFSQSSISLSADASLPREGRLATMADADASVTGREP
jgi:hypothetical protein